ncbi:hypothetical protein [Mesoplasma florum]|uniref:hypothetical protein n=1 Tax=Mesoplasma florum TaxID=2151 RepID=UPI000BE435B7|nr:hypothetical protein [Mesoplasma florum]ATI73415.1 hypothetical protein CQZ69_02485 [Mesoplasma florum]AVN61817.1 hypothetical protein CG004_02510 [Mesoplasma florum]
MKKLLLALSSLAVVGTSAMTVISCGDKGTTDPEGPNEKDIIRDLIRKFETEVTQKFGSLVSTPMNAKSTMLDEEASGQGLIFFQKDNLEKVYNNAKENNQGEIEAFAEGDYPPVTFYNILDDTQKKELSSNVDSLLGPTRLMSSFRSSISKSTYQVLIGTFGDNWIENLKFDYANAKLQYAPTDSTNTRFISNVNLSFSTNYKYFDEEQQTASKPLRGNVVITITDDGDIKIAIDSITNKMAGDLLLEGDSKVFTDLEALRNYSPSLTSQDLLTANTLAYNAAIANYNQAFAKGLTSAIKSKYFTNQQAQILNTVNVSFYNPNDIIREETTNHLSNVPPINKTYNAKEDWPAWNTFFGKVKTDTRIQLNGQSVQGDKTLYQAVESNWTTALEKNQQVIKSEYENKTKNSEVEEAAKTQGLLSMSVSSETVTVQNLQIGLANGYTQPLSDIGFTYSIAINNNATALAETTDSAQSAIFNSFYKGIEQMLNVFHKFYGIEESNIFRSPSATEFQLRNKFKMSGATGISKEDGTEFNIWDYWASIPEFIGGQKSSTNEILSLDYGTEASQIKTQYLLSQMYGVSDFTMFHRPYSSNTGNNGPNVRYFYLQNEDYNAQGDGSKLKKGLALHQSRTSTQGTGFTWGLNTSLLNLEFNSDNYDRKQDGPSTIIERI